MVICSFLFVLFLVHNSLGTKDINLLQNSGSFDETVLCRSCGKDVTSSRHILTKFSSASKYTFNDTLFNRSDVVVQVLMSDLFLHFPLITFIDSDCTGAGELLIHL